MSKSNKATVATIAPVVAVAATPAPVKVAKYAPAQAVVNPNAVITVVRVGNPKRAGTKAHARYGQFHGAAGTTQTVGAFVQAYVAAGLGGLLARADLRWEMAHGFITIEAPVAIAA